MIQLMMNLGIVPWPLNTDLTAYWTMWGTVATTVAAFATAVATGALVWMAWRAWKAALDTLKGQQTHAEIVALKDYMNALHALGNISMTTPASHMPTEFMRDTGLRIAQMKAAYGPYVDSVANDVKVAGSIWRAYHADDAAGEFGVAEDVLIQSQVWRKDPEAGTEDSADAPYLMNTDFAVSVAAHALRWQVGSESRPEESQSMRESMSAHWNGSPCRHAGASPVNTPRRLN